MTWSKFCRRGRGSANATSSVFKRCVCDAGLGRQVELNICSICTELRSVVASTSREHLVLAIKVRSLRFSVFPYLCDNNKRATVNAYELRLAGAPCNGRWPTLRVRVATCGHSCGKYLQPAQDLLVALAAAVMTSKLSGLRVVFLWRQGRTFRSALERFEGKWQLSLSCSRWTAVLPARVCRCG